MQVSILLCSIALATCIAAFAAPAAAQVNYHSAQQAGKVWGDKVSDNIREERAGDQRRVNSKGIAYDAPLTAADRSLALAENRAGYDRLVDSVGEANAERWLAFKARQARARR